MYLTDGAWRFRGAETLPSRLADWLLDPGSLTAKLKALHQDFSLEVLSHRRSAPQPDEAKLLPAQWAYQVREVLLYSNKVPVVYARSLIPDLEGGDAGELNELGDQPLGEALFNRGDVSCGPLAVCHFDAESAVAHLNKQLLGIRRDLWGRRRLFKLGSQAILVAEVFLSPAPCYEEP